MTKKFPYENYNFIKKYLIMHKHLFILIISDKTNISKLYTDTNFLH
ncbi:hypothetical protein EMUCRT_0139 [Ehrlichia cf. muris str. EmCRT]|uniref:Uncharacterized protein n=1 Tax=Ehrlichia cf. muris str. EmCRT TaxID=1359167 RepID=A0A0F3NGC3_9RICK|nr:hypothetical protein EMUCRT_0139 [Ehrlichia cf. muris str. EmCRT]